MAIAAESVQPDESIVHPLEQLRGAIRQFVLLDGLLSAGLFVLAWFWLGLIIDLGLFKLTNFDWVLDAPRFFRVFVLATLAVLLLSILVTRLVLRLNRQFSYPTLALVLEKRFPDILGDKLITAVEMADVEAKRQQGYSEAMIRATIDEARARVAEVPIDSVFNWARLRGKAWILAGAALGMFLLAYLVFAIFSSDRSGATFARQFVGHTLIWGERNLLLFNTPWPRRAHIELLNFPGDELRVGKGGEPPRIRARAYRWVIADRSAPFGWRPLNWSDITPSLLGTSPPTLTASILTSESKPLSGMAVSWDVDQIEAVAGNAPELRALFTRLEEIASRPRLRQTLRRLEIPDNLSLTYRGPNTYNDFSMTREPNNEFTVDVSGLTESVRFTLKGADFRTLPRAITLVPPPMFTRLTRIEYPPAYLFHPPPFREGGAVNWEDLKGLRQAMPEKDLSLTGDRTVFSVVQGTDLEVMGISDKPLQRIELKPRIGRLPGMTADANGTGTNPPLPVILNPVNPQRDRFAIAFRGEFRPASPTLEFDLTLIDDDNVATTRTLLVQVTEDQPPSVELGIDVLRKQGTSYLATPVARIPFLTESKVRDDFGLSQVEFVISYTQVETQVVVNLQAQALATLWSSTPLIPGLPAALAPAAGATVTQLMTRPERRLTARYPVPKFREAFAELGLDTPALLQKKLQDPLELEQSRSVREVRFVNQDFDALDLARAVPSLQVQEAGAIQPRFRIELNLQATDTNVESGPRMSQNLEPIRLTIVSEAELLAEMSKDEESLSAKLDDVLKRLKEAQVKLTQTAERLSGTSPPAEVIVNATVRAQDITLDMGKARDTSSLVLTEFRRLYREARFNVLRDEILTRYQRDIISPLDSILQNEFVISDEAHKQFQTALVEGKRPDDLVMQSDRVALQSLIVRMQSLRDQLGEAISLNKIRDTLRKLIEDEQNIGRVLKTINKQLIEDLYAPTIASIPPVELMKGQKLLVQQAINWQAFTGSNFTIRFEGPSPDQLVYPASVKVPDDKDVLEYEVMAGNKPGDYKLTLRPSAGKPLEVIVRIK